MTMTEPHPPERSPSFLDLIRARTPARILTRRVGGSYSTSMQLSLREDHAAALDAVHTEFDLTRDLGSEFVDRFGLFEVATQARDKREYLMRPDLGRLFTPEVRELLPTRCPAGVDLQVAIGDGLSASAVITQVPLLLPLLQSQTLERGWSWGQPFFIRHCRVGVLNDIGNVLDPTVVVLLIGERPGLATAESLSAYLAYRPRPGDTDARRNLISNIHARGVSPMSAAGRILGLAESMRRMQMSGTQVKEVGNILGER